MAKPVKQWEGYWIKSGKNFDGFIGQDARSTTWVGQASSPVYKEIVYSYYHIVFFIFGLAWLYALFVLYIDMIMIFAYTIVNGSFLTKAIFKDLKS